MSGGGQGGRRTMRARLGDAARGLEEAWREEAALRIAVGWAAAGTAAAWLLVEDPALRLLLAAGGWGVAGAELVNRAVERAVDVGSEGRWSEPARKAKDAAAAIVLAAVALWIVLWITALAQRAG